VTRNPEQYPNLKIFEADDGYIVYHRERDRVHFLNHTAVLLLELCNGKHSVSDMISIKEVTDIISRFGQEGLIQSN
jgi:hypothetical protein